MNERSAGEVLAAVEESLRVKRSFFGEHAHELIAAACLVAGAFRSSRKLLVFGNGGSACDAQHIAGELVNRFLTGERRALPAIALSTDGGVLTCIANDTGFENVFARQLEALGQPGDVCLAISTSGNSRNIVRGAEAARRIGMSVIGMLGREGGEVAGLCDVALIVGSSDTQRIQETHNLIGHILCELVEREMFGAV